MEAATGQQRAEKACRQGQGANTGDLTAWDLLLHHLLRQPRAARETTESKASREEAICPLPLVDDSSHCPSLLLPYTSWRMLLVAPAFQRNRLKTHLQGKAPEHRL